MNDKPKKPRKKREPKNIPKTQNLLEEEMCRFLPSRLLRCDYRIKTDEAPCGQRYCNAFCQTYQPLEIFMKKSLSHLTVCQNCEALLDVAHERVENGSTTEEQIRNDPSILKIEEDEMACRSCHEVKKLDEFPEKRRQCKKCRNSVRSKYGTNFDNIIETEVKQLSELTDHDEMKSKLGKYVKDELQKLISYLKLGRKYNDTKEIMKENLLKHFCESDS